MTETRLESPPQAARGRLDQLLMSSKVAGAMEVALVLSVPVALIAGVRSLPGDNAGLEQLAVLTAILLMVALAYVGLRLRGQRWGHFGLTFGRPSASRLGRTLLQSLLTFVAAAALFVGAAYGYAWLAPATEGAEATGLEFLRGNLPMLLITLLIIYVTASFSEEVIYRGFLMNRIAALGGGTPGAWGAAIVLSSIAFGLAHFSWGPAGMVQTGFMGLGLAAGYLAFGRRLWVVIIAHGCMDTILLVQAYLSS